MDKSSSSMSLQQMKQFLINIPDFPTEGFHALTQPEIDSLYTQYRNSIINMEVSDKENSNQPSSENNEDSVMTSKAINNIPNHIRLITKTQYIYPLKAIQKAFSNDVLYKASYNWTLKVQRNDILAILSQIYPRSRIRIFESLTDLQLIKHYHTLIRQTMKKKNRKALKVNKKTIQPIQRCLVYIPLCNQQKQQMTVRSSQEQIKIYSKSINNIKTRYPPGQSNVVQTIERQSQFMSQHEQSVVRKISIIQRVEEEIQQPQIQEPSNQAEEMQPARNMEDIMEQLCVNPEKLFIPDCRKPERRVINPEVKNWIRMLRQLCDQFEKNCPQYIQIQPEQ